MILRFLKNLVGAPESEAEPAAKPKVPAATTDQPDLEEFVKYVVCSLVDAPDAVNVKSVDKERGTEIQVSCEKKDIGKVIGRSGRTIGAIRALANGAGGRMGQKVTVEVLD